MSDISSQPQPSLAIARPDVPLSGDVQSMVAERRARLGVGQRLPADASTWGLALSGGGMRSATFCFGLLKALAKNQVFHRFDVLSTVSGGGYIGATVGRLFHDVARTGQSAQDIETALADADNRWFAFWLRANGRYLIPRGGKDLLFAVANFGRNLVGVHIELALLCLLLGSLLVEFDLALWQLADCLTRNTCSSPEWLTKDMLGTLSQWPTLWILMPLLILAAASLAAAYWVLPSKAGEILPLRRWIAVVLCLLGCWTLLDYWSTRPLPDMQANEPQLPGWLLLADSIALVAWVIGSVIAQCMTFWHPDVSRKRLTSWLAWTLKIGSSVLVLGLVDVMAWLLANSDAEHQGAVGAATLLSVVALRAVLPKIADLPRSLTPGTRVNLAGLINVAGLAVLLLLLVFWVSIVHRIVTLALFADAPRLLQFALAWSWLSVITLPVALMMGVSLRNRDFLNRSSLYTFYRARLVRAYLGAGNVERFGGHPQAATAAYQCHEIARGDSVSVQDVHAGDDVAMADYAPHVGGGPVHLINACVNQTHDPRGGLFNQDRKGLPITVGPQGRVRVGDEGWRTMDRSEGLTLGSWMAISGAAVAPGLGSSTKPGIASLLTMCGIRLGYWWSAPPQPRDAGAHAPSRVGKYDQLLAELQGRFGGTERADWYLSDGGHFENTAAYALLREECALVIVADCGADPRYVFGDLENLVRKARIDLQAEITFLKPKLPTTLAIFGSLNDLASPDSQACLALARIDYRSGKIGFMIVVKPNMCVGAPVDLVNFKADHPLFPQEPTTDQLFSEAQWESYFHLGYTMGLNLQRQMLDDLPYVARTLFEFDDGSVVTRDEHGRLHVASAPKRLPSRIVATGAVTASVSLGAFATLGAASWQAIEQQMKKWEEARRVHPAVLKELTDLYGKRIPEALPEAQTTADSAAQAALPVGTIPAAAAAAPASVAGATASQAAGQAALTGAENTPTRLGEMATALLLVGETVCTPQNTAAYQNSSLIQTILSDTKQSCRTASLRHKSCDRLLDTNNVKACLREQDKDRINCDPRYWIRNPGGAGLAKQNCLLERQQLSTAPPLEGQTTECPLTILGWRPLTILEWLGLRPKKDSESSLPICGTSGSAVPPSFSPTSVPVPSSSSSPVTATPVVADNTPQRPFNVCKDRTVYIQIFGPEMRESVRLLREPWRDLGASVPPVEDVVDTARRRGRKPPQEPSQPTVIYHDEGSKACAKQLQPPGMASSWSVRLLSPQLTGTPGTIEVWIPRLAEAATGQGIPPPRKSFCYQEDSKLEGAQRYGVHCHAEAAACDKARGPNSRRAQSACTEVDTSTVATMLNRRGWAGSWYALRAEPFGKPFPRLP